MATLQPKTKQEILNDISNGILNNYLEGMSGLCRLSTKEFNKYLKQADANKSGDFAMFHYIHALIYTAQHKYEDAHGKYVAALRINSSNVAILNNYATLLIDLCRYDKAFEIVNKLMKLYNLNGDVTINSLIRLSVRTLNTSYLDEISEGKVTPEIYQTKLKLCEQIIALKRDIQEIGISNEEYTEYFEFLSKFVLNETNQTFHPRFTIDNGLDGQLNIEVFLDINSKEVSYLDSEFRSLYLDYIFDNERQNLLGKFVVFFRQKKNRYDGTDNLDALYLGMNKELVA